MPYLTGLNDSNSSISADDYDFLDILNSDLFNILIGNDKNTPNELGFIFSDYLNLVNVGKSRAFVVDALKSFYYLVADVEFLSREHIKKVQEAISQYVRRLQAEGSIAYHGEASDEFFEISRLFDDFLGNSSLLLSMLNDFIAVQHNYSEMVSTVDLLLSFAYTRKELCINAEVDLLKDYIARLQAAKLTMITYGRVQYALKV